MTLTELQGGMVLGFVIGLAVDQFLAWTLRRARKAAENARGSSDG